MGLLTGPEWWVLEAAQSCTGMGVRWGSESERDGMVQSDSSSLKEAKLAPPFLPCPRAVKSNPWTYLLPQGFSDYQIFFLLKQQTSLENIIPTLQESGLT